MKRYILFESYETLNAQQPIGIFTQEGLIKRLYAGEMDTTSVVTVERSREAPITIHELPFIRTIMEPKSEKTFGQSLVQSGYRIPSTEIEWKIRNKNDGVYRNIWKCIRDATNGVSVSPTEMDAFLQGYSINALLTKRFNHSQTVLTAYSDPFFRPTKLFKPKIETRVEKEGVSTSFIDVIFAIPVWGWILGAFGVLLILAYSSPNAGRRGYSSPPVLTKEDQFIRDAVRLQRMIDAGEKERNDKFRAEYQRQERGYE